MKISSLKNSKLHPYIIGAIVVLIVLFFELFIFNFRHFESLGFQNNKVNNIAFKEVTYEELKSSDSTSLIIPILDSKEEDKTYLESNEFLEEIDNISFASSNFVEDSLNGKYESAGKALVNIYIRDEGNAFYYQLPTYEVDSIYKANQYLRIHTYGKTKQILFEVASKNLKSADDCKVEFNTAVPLVISKTRILFMLILICIIIGLHPKARCLANIGNKTILKRLSIIAIVIFEVALLYWIANHVYAVHWKDLEDNTSHIIYAKLTEALANGHFWLDYNVSDIQLNAENPYDRLSLLGTGIFDNAYYNGKYYCYFGVLPVLLFYLPYYLITHTILKNWIVVTITFFLISFSLMFLLLQLKRRYFPAISFRNFIILDLLLFFGTGCIFIGLEPYFYSMIILLGISLTAFGIAFWTKATNTGKNSLYVVGAVFMALVCMARPTLLLGSILVIPFAIMPLYKKYIKLQNDRKRFIKIIIISSIPYVIVAVAQMYYNYKRFGSPIDFGANYNITTNDMTHRGIVFDRCFPGIFEYVLQPPRLCPEFPYLEGYNFSMEHSGYIGTTIMEKSYGGYLWLCPASLFSTLFLFKKYKSELQTSVHYSEIKTMSIISLAIAISLVFSDVQIAGILFRYFQDFGFFFSITALIPLGIMLERSNKRIESVAYGATIYTILIWAFVVMSFMFNYIYE